MYMTITYDVNYRKTTPITPMQVTADTREGAVDTAITQLRTDPMEKVEIMQVSEAAAAVNPVPPQPGSGVTGTASTGSKHA
jgi:acetyl-CoA acetyltransferase